MLRYLRLYLNFLRFSFSKALEFRLDFYFRIIMDCAFYAMHIVFFTVLFRHIPTLGGWSYDQTIIFASGCCLVDALHMTVFSNNMWWFPILVNKGDLDYYLVRPVSTLFFVSLRDFAANSFVNLIIAAAIMCWALARYPEPLGAGSIVLFVCGLMVGTVIYWMLFLMCLIPVFWFHKVDGFRQFFFSLSHLSERPHQIYRGWVGRTLLTLIPLAVITSVPAHMLFRGPNWQDAAHILAVLVGTFAVLLSLWKLALRSYSSASS